MDYHGLTQDELKQLCRNRNLKVGGNKGDLIERLKAASEAGVVLGRKSKAVSKTKERKSSNKTGNGAEKRAKPDTVQQDEPEVAFAGTMDADTRFRQAAAAGAIVDADVYYSPPAKVPKKGKIKEEKKKLVKEENSSKRKKGSQQLPRRAFM